MSENNKLGIRNQRRRQDLDALRICNHSHKFEYSQAEIEEQSRELDQAFMVYASAEKAAIRIQTSFRRKSLHHSSKIGSSNDTTRNTVSVQVEEHDEEVGDTMPSLPEQLKPKHPSSATALITKKLFGCTRRQGNATDLDLTEATSFDGSITQNRRSLSWPQNNLSGTMMAHSEMAMQTASNINSGKFAMLLFINEFPTTLDNVTNCPLVSSPPQELPMDFAPHGPPKLPKNPIQ